MKKKKKKKIAKPRKNMQNIQNGAKKLQKNILHNKIDCIAVKINKYTASV